MVFIIVTPLCLRYSLLLTSDPHATPVSACVFLVLVSLVRSRGGKGKDGGGGGRGGGGEKEGKDGEGGNGNR